MMMMTMKCFVDFAGPLYQCSSSTSCRPTPPHTLSLTLTPPSAARCPPSASTPVSTTTSRPSGGEQLKVNKTRLRFSLPLLSLSPPVTPQAPSSALPTQAGVGVATTVHLNHMQLMAVDRIGLPSAQISTQGIQPAPIGVQSIHTSAPAQGIQPAPIVTQQQQQGQAEAKPGNSPTKLRYHFR